jgi:hypothetical protein
MATNDRKKDFLGCSFCRSFKFLRHSEFPFILNHLLKVLPLTRPPLSLSFSLLLSLSLPVLTLSNATLVQKYCRSLILFAFVRSLSISLSFVHFRTRHFQPQKIEINILKMLLQTFVTFASIAMLCLSPSGKYDRFSALQAVFHHHE